MGIDWSFPVNWLRCNALGDVDVCDRLSHRDPPAGPPIEPVPLVTNATIQAEPSDGTVASIKDGSPIVAPIQRSAFESQQTEALCRRGTAWIDTYRHIFGNEAEFPWFRDLEQNLDVLRNDPSTTWRSRRPISASLDGATRIVEKLQQPVLSADDEKYMERYKPPRLPYVETTAYLMYVHHTTWYKIQALLKTRFILGHTPAFLRLSDTMAEYKRAEAALTHMMADQTKTVEAVERVQHLVKVMEEEYEECVRVAHDYSNRLNGMTGGALPRSRSSSRSSRSRSSRRAPPRRRRRLR